MNTALHRRRHCTIFCDRYWPASDDNTLYVRNWASALLEAGCHVSVIAPKWASSWPDGYELEGLTVDYAVPPPTSAFRYRKFANSVAGLLTNKLSETNAVYCDRPGLMAETVTTTLAKHRKAGLERDVRVIVRYRDSIDGQRSLPEGKSLAILRAADLVLVTSAAEHRLVLSVGIVEAKIVRHEPMASRVDRSQTARSAARRILYDASYELTIKSTDSLIVCMCDFRTQGDIHAIVDAVKQLLETQRQLRLWLVGEGNARSDVYEALRFEGIHRLVVMPGVFVSPWEALQVADLVIVPPSGEGRFWVMPTCLRSGIPVVYPAVEDLRRLVSRCSSDGKVEGPGQLGCYDRAAGGLKEAIGGWLSNRQHFSEHAAALARAYPQPNLDAFAWLVDEGP